MVIHTTAGISMKIVQEYVLKIFYSANEKVRKKPDFFVWK